MCKIYYAILRVQLLSVLVLLLGFHGWFVGGFDEHFFERGYFLLRRQHGVVEHLVSVFFGEFWRVRVGHVQKSVAVATQIRRSVVGLVSVQSVPNGGQRVVHFIYPNVVLAPFDQWGIRDDTFGYIRHLTRLAVVCRLQQFRHDFYEQSRVGLGVFFVVHDNWNTSLMSIVLCLLIIPCN